MSTDDAARPWYLLPVRIDDASRPIDELTEYLRSVARYCSVLVVDGSPPPRFDRRAWAPITGHVAPDPALWSTNGKAHGVNTGVAELGRRRSGGRTVFPARAALAAPLWTTHWPTSRPPVG